MSFIDCINGNADLTPAQKRDIIADYEKHAAWYKKSLGSSEAASKAAAEYAQIKADIQVKKNFNAQRDAVMWFDIKKKIEDKATAYQEFKDLNVGGKLLGAINPVVRASKDLLNDVGYRIESMERVLTNGLADVLDEFSTKFAGLTQDTKGFREVVKGTVDGNFSGEFGKFSKQLTNVFAYAHKGISEAGGILGRVENFFPSFHDPVRIAKFKVSEWKADILRLNDTSKLIDERTALPYTAAELDKKLDQIYETITSNGLNIDAERSAKGMGNSRRRGGIATHMNHERFFQFKNGDAFLEYNAKYGVGDSGLYDAMTAYMKRAARDIGILQELGPNPDGMVNRIVLKSKASGALGVSQDFIRGQFDLAAGRMSAHGKTSWWYNGWMGMLELSRAAVNGVIPLSTTSDIVFTSNAAKLSGLPATKAIKQYLKLLNPLDDTDRRIASRVMFVAQSTTGMAIRNISDLDGGGRKNWTNKLSSFTNRASGLSAQTDALRNALPLTAQGFFAQLKEAKVKWKDVPTQLKESLALRDIGEKEFNSIMKASTFSPIEGATFIRSEDVAQIDLDTAKKLELWFMALAHQASNEPNLEVRYITTWGAKEGSIQRMAAATVMMYKSFAFSSYMNHILPALRRTVDPRKTNRFGSLMLLGPGLMMTGALTIQLRNIVNGKTTEDMETGDFWKRSLAQSGLLGIGGDFALPSEYGDWGDIILGPQGKNLKNLSSLKEAFWDGALEGDLDKVLKNGWKAAKGFIPAQNMWYSKLFFDRFLLDQANRMVDETYDHKLMKAERKMAQEKDQEYWWKPAELLPK